MTVVNLRYIDINKAVLACDVCAAALEASAADLDGGVRLRDLRKRFDDALVAVLGSYEFTRQDTYELLAETETDDDEVDNPETPKF
jgi:hypothetical protein